MLNRLIQIEKFFPRWEATVAPVWAWALAPKRSTESSAAIAAIVKTDADGFRALMALPFSRQGMPSPVREKHDWTPVRPRRVLHPAGVRVVWVPGRLAE